MAHLNCLFSHNVYTCLSLSLSLFSSVAKLRSRSSAGSPFLEESLRATLWGVEGVSFRSSHWGTWQWTYHLLVVFAIDCYWPRIWSHSQKNIKNYIKLLKLEVVKIAAPAPLVLFKFLQGGQDVAAGVQGHLGKREVKLSWGIMGYINISISLFFFLKGTIYSWNCWTSMKVWFFTIPNDEVFL